MQGPMAPIPTPLWALPRGMHALAWGRRGASYIPMHGAGAYIRGCMGMRISMGYILVYSDDPIDDASDDMHAMGAIPLMHGDIPYASDASLSP